MGLRCTGEVRGPVEQAPAGARPCADDEVSSFTYVWPSLRRGKTLNALRDPLEHDFSRLPDGRPWVGSRPASRTGRMEVHHRRDGR